jgi:hypothetical protein
VKNAVLRELQWYGHVIRMAEERKPRQILGARPIGKRKGKHGRM